MINSFLIRNRFLLIVSILALSFLPRIWLAIHSDFWGDEASYAFRSVGYVDYLGTNSQTQPIDWYKDTELPSWTKFSFHDHPPLFFAVGNIFFNIFGDSIIVARMPSVIFGVFSVLLFYLIIKRLCGSESAALLASFVFAVNPAMIWISSVAFMESVLIFFILFNIYSFFVFLEKRRFWWMFGLSFGLILLTKYTGVFILAVYLAYIFLKDRSVFKDWRLYGSGLLSLVVFSPVLIYNFFLYKARGHFDLQLSYFFNQKTAEWTGLLGKTQSPFADIGTNLFGLFGWAIMIVGALGFIFLVYSYFKNRKAGDIFWIIYAIALFLMFYKIGSAYRFIALLAPALSFFCVRILLLVWRLRKSEKMRYTFKFIAIIFLAGIVFVCFGRIKAVQGFDYGAAKLDNYFLEEFKGKKSAIVPESGNKHLNEVVNDFSKRIERKKAKDDYSVIVYNDNLNLSIIQWIFYRRFFYHSIPTFFVEDFVRILQTKGQDYFKGINIYFVQSTKDSLLNPFKAEKTIGFEFEKNLLDQGLKSVKEIFGSENKEMFKVYKISL